RGDGLKHLGNCPGLVHLSLVDCPLAEPDLAALAPVRQLELGGTSVGDQDLERLAKVTGLRKGALDKTKGSEAGVKKLAATLPLCQINWDGGTIEPRTNPRAALEWVLAVGGVVVLGGERQVTRAKDLPADLARVTRVWLSTRETVNGVGARPVS